MAVPIVFVGSIYYDLWYVREGLRRLIESFGYIADRAKEATVFYDPN